MIQAIFRFSTPSVHSIVLKTYYANWEVYKLLNYLLYYQILIFKIIKPKYCRKINKMLVKSINTIIELKFMLRLTINNYYRYWQENVSKWNTQLNLYIIFQMNGRALS